jgi:hypothetical protein
MGWADSAESSNRQLIETCNHINDHLRMLLEDVYTQIYPGAIVPNFILRALPTLCLEQVFDSLHLDAPDSTWCTRFDSVHHLDDAMRAPAIRGFRRAAHRRRRFFKHPKGASALPLHYTKI